MSATVLLTGATGYIGGRLLRRFEEDGRAVRCLVRQPARLGAIRPSTEIIQGDCLDEASLDRALSGIHTAYYLVHSMASGSDFASIDRQAADNFGRASARAGVRRIVYLGGLTDESSTSSAHLRSRAETGSVLRASGVPIVEFRASIVIGAGSLSFEMIQALVERLPVMICPQWVATLTQPIAISDVLAYLEAALGLPEGVGGIFEIGGPEVVSYGDMMQEYAQLRGLHRWLVPVPVLTPRLSGLWLALVTPAQARVGRALVEGLRNPTVVRSLAARETFRIEPMPLRDAFVNAIDEGASARRKEDARTIVVDVPPARAFASVRRIGGDAIDGWTVQTCEPDRRLRLSVDLKLPGRGWLEFEVTPLDGGTRSMIRQTATFDPRGVLGRVFWYALLPVHRLILRGMLKQISRVASVQPLRAEPVYTVDNVNLDRYLGDWFEIARFPNRFQRACAGDVRASYARRSDGRIAVINRCRTADGRVTEARGVARIVDSRTFAKLKVRFAPAVLSFLPVVWGDYWILGLASDYSWAVVGSPNREYLWILARTPTLDAERFASAAAAARADGFDVERLKKTNHSNPEGT